MQKQVVDGQEDYKMIVRATIWQKCTSSGESVFGSHSSRFPGSAGRDDNDNISYMLQAVSLEGIIIDILTFSIFYAGRSSNRGGAAGMARFTHR
jgi:hypothetical protein